MNKENDYKKYTTFGSGIALAATGVAAFTTAAPILTGVCIGAGILGSGYATYNFYKSLEAHRKETEKSEDSTE